MGWASRSATARPDIHPHHHTRPGRPDDRRKHPRSNHPDLEMAAGKTTPMTKLALEQAFQRLRFLQQQRKTVDELI
ncbi:MAG TPA: hypothetical protein VI874_00130, partial [Candidatus Norongarragalinales archaeon]|nr:hypothetical protein [Candidatus Norongarragalinales archaeon]